VCDFIHKNLTEDIERGHLAKVAHLSEGAFSRFFRSRTGRTVPEYVNELRIGRACLMLAEERLNITDIGLDCGFRNLANFNRRFRDIMKMTPRDYRRKFAKVSVADAVR
jgi:AraC-like DNA-binding protein